MPRISGTIDTLRDPRISFLALMCRVPSTIQLEDMFEQCLQYGLPIARSVRFTVGSEATKGSGNEPV